ncbi:MAG: hypothetical protein WAN60_18385 [Candidatus Sulfotelmatobacter sp.]
MRHPGMKSGLRLALLLIALCAASTLHAQAPVYTHANLTVCNKGTVGVAVVVAERSLAINFMEVLHVDGWVVVDPGACQQVYHETENGNVERAQPAYIGFGFRDAQHRFVTGTVDPVPDFGRLLVEKILTKPDYKFCVSVSNNRVFYNIKDAAFYHTEDPTNNNCAGFHPARVASVANDGPFFSLAAALYFQPVTGSCYQTDCSDSDRDYFLNVAPGRNDGDGNLHASLGSPSGATVEPADPARGLADLLTAVEEVQLQQARNQQAAREEAQKQTKAAAAAGVRDAQVPAQIVKREEEDNRQRWAGSRQSPASYDPRWMGQNIVVVGTVSRVEIAPGGSPQWVTIYFKESPGAAFVVCSPYPDLFQEKVGLDLSVMVGKTMEAAGQVESPYCGHKVPKGSIRVVESTQWQLH